MALRSSHLTGALIPRWPHGLAGDTQWASTNPNCSFRETRGRIELACDRDEMAWTLRRRTDTIWRNAFVTVPRGRVPEPKAIHTYPANEGRSDTMVVPSESSAGTANSVNDFSAPTELNRLLTHYTTQCAKWMNTYYATKVAIIILAASIPILTTVDAAPWGIAIVGALIGALESVSQLWHFHDRYVSARMLVKALERERIAFVCGGGEYEALVGDARERRLALQISALLDRYESEVRTILKQQAADKKASVNAVS